MWSFEGCRRSAVESGVRSGRTSLPAEGCGELHGGLSSLRPRITSALGPGRRGRMEKDPGVGEQAGRRPACRKQAGGTRGGGRKGWREADRAKKAAGRRQSRRADGPVAAERRTEATRTGWRVTEDESGGRDGPVGGAVAARVSDERSEELAGQDRSSRFPVSRDRPREATPSDARRRRERAGLG